MLEQQAIVTHIDGEKVTIRSQQVSACQACAAKDSCGTSAYAQFLPDHEIILRSQIDLQAGDQVLVGIEAHHLVMASFFAYLLPLIVMLTIVGLYDGSDAEAAVMTVIGLGLGLWLVNHYQYAFARRWISPPKILNKC